MNKPTTDVKLLVSKQLKKYREATGLTQKQYAAYHGYQQASVGVLEEGNKNTDIETIQQHAEAFGVMFYELCDPNFPIPSLEKMPLKLQRYVNKVENEELDRKSLPRQALSD